MLPCPGGERCGVSRCGGVEAEFVGERGDLGAPCGEGGDHRPGDAINVGETSFDGLPGDAQLVGEVPTGDGTCDVSGGLGVMMEEARIECLGAPVGGSNVCDDDVVVELRFKVAVRDVPKRRGPNTIGFHR